MDDVQPPYTQKHHPRRRTSDHVSAWSQPLSAGAGIVLALLGVISGVSAYFGANQRTAVAIENIDTRLEAIEHEVVGLRSADVRGDMKAMTVEMRELRDAIARSESTSRELSRRHDELLRLVYESRRR